MIHHLLRLRSATLALAAFSGYTFAGQALPVPFADSVLRDYVTHRWLYGNSNELAKTLEHRVYQIPVYAMQLAGNRLHSRERNTQTVQAFRAFARDHGAKEPSRADMARQLELWTDCLVTSYRAELQLGDIDTIKRFVESGVFRIVPQLNRAIQDWPLEVMQQAKEVRDEASATPTTSSERAKTGSLRIALAIADPINAKYMIYFGVARNDAFRERYESTLGTKLPALAASVGVDATAWAELRAYASSNLYMKEQQMLVNCESTPSYVNAAIGEWYGSVHRAMLPYFQENKAQFIGN